MSQDRYTYLIYKELKDTLSVSENTELQNWLNSSPNNRLHQQQILDAVHTIDSNPPSFEVDVEADYTKVAKRLGFDMLTVSAQPKSNPANKWFWVVALLLGISAAVFFYCQGKTSEAPVYRALNTIDKVETIQLADGSSVTLNKSSQLLYPDYFDSDRREVKLVGEGFFNIARDESKPFVITTQESEVTVLGTSFNLSAYSNEDNTSVSVMTGKVRMTNAISEKSVVVIKGEKGIIEQGNITKTQESSENILAWKSNTLKFKSTRLEQVFVEMSDFYNVTIINDSVLLDCSYSMTSQFITLDTLMTNLKKIFKFDVERNGNGDYVITGGSC